MARKAEHPFTRYYGKNNVVEDLFGSYNDPLTKTWEYVRRYTFTNTKMIVRIITYGGIITSIQVPNAEGVLIDVALGFDELDLYREPENKAYFGAVVGRVANRIRDGTFKLRGREIHLVKNLNNKHTLHGGHIGFSRVNWKLLKIDTDRCYVKLMHTSPEKHQGFPGKVYSTIAYQLTEDNAFHIRFSASSTTSTPVNMTNHTYFNLAGHGAGSFVIEDHKIQINADKITVTDDESIPTGEFMDVEGTPYDFREPALLGERICQVEGKGFDDNYCVNIKNSNLTLVAKAMYEKNGIQMEVISDQPGLQFYTANSLPNPLIRGRPIIGKNSTSYVKQGAFCFETQGYPDSVNHPNFPSIILDPGRIYDHNVIYKFGIISQNEGKDNQEPKPETSAKVGVPKPETSVKVDENEGPNTGVDLNQECESIQDSQDTQEPKPETSVKSGVPKPKTEVKIDENEEPKPNTEVDLNQESEHNKDSQDTQEPKPKSSVEEEHQVPNPKAEVKIDENE